MMSGILLWIANIVYGLRQTLEDLICSMKKVRPSSNISMMISSLHPSAATVSGVSMKIHLIAYGLVLMVEGLTVFTLNQMDLCILKKTLTIATAFRTMLSYQ